MMGKLVAYVLLAIFAIQMGKWMAGRAEAKWNRMMSASLDRVEEVTMEAGEKVSSAVADSVANRIKLVGQ